MRTCRSTATVALLALALAACSPADAGDETAAAAARPGDADVDACETFIKAGLEVPDSYRLLSVSRHDQPIGVDDYLAARGMAADDEFRVFVEFFAEKGLELRTVTIESAADAFDGSPMRNRYTCAFTVVDGELESPDMLRHIVAGAVSRRDLRQMARDGLVAGNPADPAKPGPKYDCCLGA